MRRADAEPPEAHRRLDRHDHIEVVDRALGNRGTHGASQGGCLRACGGAPVGQMARSGQRGQIRGGLRSVTRDHRGSDVHNADGESQQHRHHRDRHQAGGPLVSPDRAQPPRPPPLQW